MLIFVVINVMEPRFTNPNNSVKKKGTMGIFWTLMLSNVNICTHTQFEKRGYLSITIIKVLIPSHWCQMSSVTYPNPYRGTKRHDKNMQMIVLQLSLDPTVQERARLDFEPMGKKKCKHGFCQSRNDSQELTIGLRDLLCCRLWKEEIERYSSYHASVKCIIWLFVLSLY